MAPTKSRSKSRSASFKSAKSKSKSRSGGSYKTATARSLSKSRSPTVYKTATRKTLTKSRSPTKRVSVRKTTITSYDPFKYAKNTVGGCDFAQGPPMTKEEALSRLYSRYAARMFSVMSKWRALDRCCKIKYKHDYTGSDLDKPEAQALAELRIQAKTLKHQYEMDCSRVNFKWGWGTKQSDNMKALLADDKAEFATLASKYGVTSMNEKLKEIDANRFDPDKWDCAGTAGAAANPAIPLPFPDMTLGDVPYDEGFDGGYGDEGFDGGYDGGYGDEGFYGDVY